MHFTRILKPIATASAALCLITGLAACGSTSNDDTLSFEWGVPTASYIAFYVAQDQGYFEDEGLNPNVQSFTSGAPVLAALESDSLDIATMGLASVFALGKDIDIRIFSFEGDAAATEGLVARAGGSIESLEDIGNGAPIGIPTGTCAQVSAYYAAEHVGIPYSNINAVDIAPNLLGNSFESNSVDAGFSWSPYIVDLKNEGSTVIGWDTEWVPGGGSCPETHFGRSAFLEEHPEVPEKIVRALDRAWTDIRETPDVASQALMTRLGVSKETADVVVERYLAVQPQLEDLTDPENRYSLVGTDGLVQQLALASEAFAELGVISEPVPIEALDDAVDDSAVQAVLNEGD